MKRYFITLFAGVFVLMIFTFSGYAQDDQCFCWPKFQGSLENAFDLQIVTKPYEVENCDFPTSPPQIVATVRGEDDNCITVQRFIASTTSCAIEFDTPTDKNPDDGIFCGTTTQEPVNVQSGICRTELQSFCGTNGFDSPAIQPRLAEVVDAIVTTANDPDTGACEVGQVDADTGEYTKMFDAGCSECGGIAVDDSGTMVVACGDDRVPVDAGAATRGLLEGAILEFDPLGRQKSSNIHGVSNYIADISILLDGRIKSYETLDEDTVHEHVQQENYIAKPLGASTLDVETAGIAAQEGRMYRTLATNVDGVPALYNVDPDTGEAMFDKELQFSPDVVIASASTRAVAIKDIQIQALDALDSIAVINPSPIAASSDLSTRAGLVAIKDADYVALFSKDPASGSEDTWAAFGIVDHETGLVDRIIEIQSEEDLLFTGLAVKRPIQRNVPTLSEWGMIILAMSLGLFGYIAIYRRKVI